MGLLKLFRGLLGLNLATMLLQAVFAGRLIDGDGRSLFLHGLTAKILVLLALTQLAAALFLRKQGLAPKWLAFANLGLVLAEIVQYGAGERHVLVLHVPLAIALFGGVVRQMLWAQRIVERPPQLETAK